jgi:uncharacterized protein DUF5063
MPDVSAQFLAAAREFRAALVADEVEDGAFARRVRDALAQVYLEAALLGPPGRVESQAADNWGDLEDSAPRGVDSRALQEKLKARFGEHDVFVDVFDPSQLAVEDIDPIERSLSQELVEIDDDLAEAITLLGEDRPDALWDVQWAFENHWGDHAHACLRPLHQMATFGVV